MFGKIKLVVLGVLLLMGGLVNAVRQIDIPIIKATFSKDFISLQKKLIEATVKFELDQIKESLELNKKQEIIDVTKFFSKNRTFKFLCSFFKQMVINLGGTAYTFDGSKLCKIAPYSTKKTLWEDEKIGTRLKRNNTIVNNQYKSMNESTPKKSNWGIAYKNNSAFINIGNALKREQTPLAIENFFEKYSIEGQPLFTHYIMSSLMPVVDEKLKEPGSDNIKLVELMACFELAFLSSYSNIQERANFRDSAYYTRFITLYTKVVWDHYYDLKNHSNVA